jgi:hypothetical protein
MQEKKSMRTVFGSFMFMVMAAAACTARAQEPVQPKPQRFDVAVILDATRTNLSAGGSFWMQGGSAEAGGSFFHGLGAVAQLTGTHSGSISAAGEPLTLVTIAFGPRYMWHAPSRKGSHPVAIFGQTLFGASHGSDSAFPVGTSVNSSATSFAFQAGGGIDWKLSSHAGWRMLQADWLHTQLPNGSTNAQNHLLLNTGIVLSF